jgi:hypothetical protein
MSMEDRPGVDWADAQPLEARRQARVVASFAEYLADYVRGNPDRALEAMESLAEWSDGNPELLARARADVVRDLGEAQVAIAENNQDAVQLLELASRAT